MKNRAVYLVLSALVSLAAAGFALSYTALKAMAAANGITSALAWLFPLVVDGAIIVAASVVLFYRVQLHRTAWLAWALLAGETAWSITLNTLHAPAGIIPAAIGATPSVTLAIAVEIIAALLQEVLQPVQNVTHPAATVAQSVQPEAPPVQAEVTLVQPPVQPNARAAQLIAYLRAHPDSTRTELAQALGVSRTTISHAVAPLVTSGDVVQAGRGLRANHTEE